MTGIIMREVRKKRLSNKELFGRLNNIESINEIYNRRCLNWFEKQANTPAAKSDKSIIIITQKLSRRQVYCDLHLKAHYTSVHDYILSSNDNIIFR